MCVRSGTTKHVLHRQHISIGVDRQKMLSALVRLSFCRRSWPPSAELGNGAGPGPIIFTSGGADVILDVILLCGHRKCLRWKYGELFKYGVRGRVRALISGNWYV